MERITFESGKCGGRLFVRGMRIRASDFLDKLAAGVTTGEILAVYRDLQIEDVTACLTYAARYIDHPRLAA